MPGNTTHNMPVRHTTKYSDCIGETRERESERPHDTIDRVSSAYVNISKHVIAPHCTALDSRRREAIKELYTWGLSWATQERIAVPSLAANNGNNAHTAS